MNMKNHCLDLIYFIIGKNRIAQIEIEINAKNKFDSR